MSTGSACVGLLIRGDGGRLELDLEREFEGDDCDDDDEVRRKSVPRQQKANARPSCCLAADLASAPAQ